MRFQTKYNDTTQIVIDHGSLTSKVGFSGNDQPAITATNNNDVTQIIQRGQIQDWDKLENLWDATFNQTLKVDPINCDLLFTTPTFVPVLQNEKISEIMFEKYDISGICFANEALLSLYAAGRLSGLSVQIGHNTTQFVPVIDGFPISSSFSRMDIAGSDITEYLSDLLWRTKNNERNLPKSELENKKKKAHYLKESHATVTPFINNSQYYNFSTKKNHLPEAPSFINKSHLFADSTIFKLKDHQIPYFSQCTEVLFSPSLLSNSDCKNVHENGIIQHIISDILNCDVDYQRDLFENIIISGGSAKLVGLSERLNAEISFKVAKEISTVKPYCSLQSNCDISSWTGGSILSSLPTFKKLKITSNEYYEFGPSIIEQKVL